MAALDQVFTALGDGTRRAILARVARGETSLSDLAAPFEMSQTAVSKHVRVLSDAGLISVSKRGRTRYCRLEAAPMQEAADWLAQYQQFWRERLDGLAQFLGEDE